MSESLEFIIKATSGGWLVKMPEFDGVSVIDSNLRNAMKKAEAEAEAIESEKLNEVKQ